MSEKQAKRKRQEDAMNKSTIRAQLSFNLLANGQVTVSGPIQDPIGVMDIIRAGLNSLVPYWAEHKKNESRIVKASVLPPNFMIQGRK